MGHDEKKILGINQFPVSELPFYLQYKSFYIKRFTNYFHYLKIVFLLKIGLCQFLFKSHITSNPYTIVDAQVFLLYTKRVRAAERLAYVVKLYTKPLYIYSLVFKYIFSKHLTPSQVARSLPYITDPFFCDIINDILN